MEKKINVKQLTLCGVLAALVFVLTYFPKVPVPVTGGYVHLGDGAIFLAVLLLGPLGIPAAAIGSGLADLIGGYMLYVIPTVIIKGLVALVGWKLYRKGSWVSAVVAFVLAEAVMVLGYFVFECFTSGAPAAAAAILPNVMQGVAGVVLGLVCVAVTPRMEKMMKL
ncbi:MAG: ECF transporter S component [Eubacteriales bacterium]|nr:ECF transporter S component [Eubacteriales bacterium]